MLGNGWVEIETRNQPMVKLCNTCDDRDSQAMGIRNRAGKAAPERGLLGGLKSYIGVEVPRHPLND